MCFVWGNILGSRTSSIAPPLSSNAVQCMRGCVNFLSIPLAITSFSNCVIGIWSHKADDSATYSASVVESAVRVWSLDDQVMGHPAYMITHPDRDFAVMGTFVAPGSSCLQSQHPPSTQSFWCGPASS